MTCSDGSQSVLECDSSSVAASSTAAETRISCIGNNKVQDSSSSSQQDSSQPPAGGGRKTGGGSSGSGKRKFSFNNRDGVDSDLTVLSPDDFPKCFPWGARKDGTCKQLGIF